MKYAGRSCERPVINLTNDLISASDEVSDIVTASKAGIGWLINGRK